MCRLHIFGKVGQLLAAQYQVVTSKHPQSPITTIISAGNGFTTMIKFSGVYNPTDRTTLELSHLGVPNALHQGGKERMTGCQDLTRRTLHPKPEPDAEARSKLKASWKQTLGWSTQRKRPPVWAEPQRQ